MFDKENTLYVEKYRPKTLEQYVCSEGFYNIFNQYVSNQDIPHLLLYGEAGGGKTTIAKILVESIDCDHIYINASDENNVDTVRDKIKSFASSIGFRDLKFVILDEAEYLTPNAQAALRNLMETYSTHTRFILTCNYVQKVIDPIQSRCQSFNIVPPSKPEVAKFLVDILGKEEIQFNNEDLVTIINNNYPDIRRMVNTCQRLSVSGTLKMEKIDLIESHVTDTVMNILKSNTPSNTKYKEIRKIISENQMKDFSSFYKVFYDECDSLFNDPCSAILDIAEYQYKSAFAIDPEINVMALIVKLFDNIRK